MNFEDFLKYYISNAPQLMWFLGAGVSRSAQIPTAVDIINEIKTKLYCQYNNLDVTEYSVLSESTLERINTFFTSKGGYPPINSPEEYSHYLEEHFKDDKVAQQKYFQGKIVNDNLSVGHKIFASLIEMKKIKAILTTNFDDVVERAVAFISNKPLKYIYHLEGSHDAVNAVDNEHSPIYIKIHGDIRYTNIKNLSEDLRKQNESLMSAFYKLAMRYGMVLTGYSGRDNSVINELSKIVEAKGAFPKGIFWLTGDGKKLPKQVHDLIDKASSNGIQAHIIEGAGNYNDVMRKIWFGIDGKPEEIKAKIQYSSRNTMLPFNCSSGKNFPKLRINAFKILKIPKTMMSVNFPDIKTYEDFGKAFKANPMYIIPYKKDSIFFWGDTKELDKIPLSKKDLISVDISEDFCRTKQCQKMMLKAILLSMTKGKPLTIRNIGAKHFITINTKKTIDDSIHPLKLITRSITGVNYGAEWREAVEIRLENVEGILFILLKPSIWIEPKEKRENCKFFLKTELKKRSNLLYNNYLDAWTKILLLNTGFSENGTRVLSPFKEGTENNPIFEVYPTNCFSGLL